MKNLLTIDAGYHQLISQAKEHRQKAEQLERLAKSFLEAGKFLQGEPEPKKTNGRPADENGRKQVLAAIEKMPKEFNVSALRGEINGMAVHKFRRHFRELRKDGVVVETVKAMGRREGRYKKVEEAVAV